MLVREVMTEEVVTVPIDGQLEDAVELMVSNAIGSVIVVADGEPVGIITETDVLLAGLRSGRTLGEIEVEEAMSRPLLSIGPDSTLRAAVSRMKDESIKKLAVMDGIELLGILTQQDVVYAQPELRREAIRQEERRQQWEQDPDGF